MFSGCIPDMSASTQSYLEIKEIYNNLANKDFQKMTSYVKEILNHKENVIEENDLKKFCKNCQYLEFIKYRTFNEECEAPLEFFFEEPHKWYFAVRGVMKFVDKFNSPPGVNFL